MGRESIYDDGAAAGNARGSFAAERSRLSRGLCQDAAAQPTSLSLEQWASMLLGAFWERRQLAKGVRGADRIAVVGERVIESIAGIGDPDAKLALLALGRIDRGALGVRARQLAAELSWPMPPRIDEVGTARLVEAFVASYPGDGEVVLLRSDGVGARGHMLVVFIDARHRSLAKHVHLLRCFDPLQPDTLPEAAPSLDFRPADLRAMCRKVTRAIKQTDAAANPPVDESFSNYRAIALARLRPLGR